VSRWSEGNSDVLHSVAPIVTSTFTDPNPPFIGTVSSISSDTSWGKVMNVHAVPPLLCQSHISEVKVYAAIVRVYRHLLSSETNLDHRGLGNRIERVPLTATTTDESIMQHLTGTATCLFIRPTARPTALIMAHLQAFRAHSLSSFLSRASETGDWESGLLTLEGSNKVSCQHNRRCGKR
jgi:hypothetical protein